MAFKRYTITIEDPATGKSRRFNYWSGPLISDTSDLLVAFTLSLRRVAVVVAVLIGTPIVFALFARWSVEAQLQAARLAATTFEAENANYKAVTKELADQVAELQTTITELDRGATLDPTTAKAIAKLPAVVKARAVGGGNGVPVRSLLSPALQLPEDTLGILRDLLGGLESRLESMRGAMEKRAERVAATPTSWPAIGWLSARVGPREDPFTHEASYHTGLDISADKGAPVFATADGTVQSTEYHAAYGNLLVIDHGFGLVTRYGHLSGFAVKPGAHVRRGQVVAYVGATGRATGPHLHYEILVNGQAIDPFRLMLEPHTLPMSVHPPD
jgi:murein DD-endopeptidase MepM/ murein hydrolase activator NlpD